MDIGESMVIITVIVMLPPARSRHTAIILHDVES
jgi:hypothetical protein